MGDTVSSLLFQPPPPTKLKQHKIIWIDTDNDSRIPGFYIGYNGVDDKARSMTMEEVQMSKPEEGITLLYSHANAEDLGSIYPWCKFLSKMLQVNLFAYDYTGYGMAYDVDSPSEEHCYADINAAYRFLRESLKVPNKNIVLYGRSLGSGPSCYLAAGTASESREGSEEGPVGGLILHAPFLSVFRIVVDTGCTVYGDKFPNIDYAPFVQSPVMLIHGTSDQIVPFNHSERLLEAIPKAHRAEPLFIDGMGHNNVHAGVRPMFVDRLTKYLEDHVWPSVDKQGKRRARQKPSRSLQDRQVRVRLVKSKNSAKTNSTTELVSQRS